MADRTKKYVKRQYQKELIVQNSSNRNGDFFDSETDVDSIYHDADHVPTFFPNEAVANKETEEGFQPAKPILWSHGKNTIKRTSKGDTNSKTEYSDLVARKPRPVSCESYEQHYLHERPSSFYNNVKDGGREARDTRLNMKEDEGVPARQPRPNRNKGSYPGDFKKKTMKASTIDSEEVANTQRQFHGDKSFEDLKSASSNDVVEEERQNSPESDCDDGTKCVPNYKNNDSCPEKVSEERASCKSKDESTRKVKRKPRWNSNFQKLSHSSNYTTESASNERNDDQKSNVPKKSAATSFNKFVKKEGAFPKRYALHDRTDKIRPEDTHATKNTSAKSQAGKSHTSKNHGGEGCSEGKNGEEIHNANGHSSKSHASQPHSAKPHVKESHATIEQNQVSHPLERYATLPFQASSLIDFDAVKKKHSSCCTECVTARARSADHVRMLSRENPPKPLPLNTLTITEEDELEKSMIFINDAVTALGMMKKLMDNVGSTKSFLEKVYNRLGNSRDVARCRGNVSASRQEEVEEKEQDDESDASSIEEVRDYEANESVRIYGSTKDHRDYFHWEPSSKSNDRPSKGRKKGREKNILELTKEWEKRNPNKRYSRN